LRGDPERFYGCLNPAVRDSSSLTMTNHLFSLVRDGVPDPAKTVIETPEGRRYSYADLIARSGAYAAALRAAGVQPGDRVAVQVEKSPEVIFLYLGV
jgi:malonyl-CoA/methylmalonyl-CoA synthetase